MCDQGWKAIWDKLLASSHPNVESSINVWCPPNSGIRERIEEVCRKYPQGYKVQDGQKKNGKNAPHLDEADFALENYHRIQRAKRKLLVVLAFISILQKSQKRVQEKKLRKLEEDHGDDANMISLFSSNLQKQGRSNISETSVLVSDTVVIRSILNDHSTDLTTSQREVLQRIVQQRQTIERRRRTIETSIPSSILQEYGTAQVCSNLASSKTTMKGLANTIIAAKQLVRLKSESDESGLYHLPAEWSRLSSESKIRLAEKLSFRSVSSWDFNAIEIAEECQGNPLLLTGWAILGSPHAQRSMAVDVGIEYDDEDGGYDFARQYRLKLSVLCSFLRLVESNYYPNPYHNSTHAADVTATTNSILQLGGKKFAESPLHVFALLVAAVVHDVKHPGKECIFYPRVFFILRCLIFSVLLINRAE